jgi:hypothetical protein
MATNTTLGQNVVKAQQLYAAQHDVSVLFEILTVALLSSKPADPLAHLHAKLVELAAVSGPLSVPAVRFLSLTPDDAMRDARASRLDSPL